MYRGILAADKSKDYEIGRVEGGKVDVGMDWNINFVGRLGEGGKGESSGRRRRSIWVIRGE